MSINPTVADVVGELREFVKERDWQQYHDLKNLSMLLASEAGELLSELRWIRSDEIDRWIERADNRARVARELGDVGIALLLLCDRLEMDVLNLVRQKIEENRATYPATASRGMADRP